MPIIHMAQSMIQVSCERADRILILSRLMGCSRRVR